MEAAVAIIITAAFIAAVLVWAWQVEMPFGNRRGALASQPGKDARNLARANTADLLKLISLGILTAGVLDPLLKQNTDATWLADALRSFSEAITGQQTVGTGAVTALAWVIILAKVLISGWVALAVYRLSVRVALRTES